MATVTPEQQTAIVNLYVALFNRAPDADGFEFWTQALANGTPLSIVTGAFFSSPETTTTYPAAQTAQQFVSAFYQTVFGRAPDAEGLIFWTDVLNAAGGPTSQSARALLVSNIVDIVSKPLTEKPADLTDAQYAETVRDRDLFSKKNVAALDFAVNVKSNDLSLAKQALVDAVAPTTPTVPTPGPSEPVGLVIPLTTNAETLSGGNGNDTFDGKIVYDNQERGFATLNSADVLDGGAGTDTLIAGLNNSDTVTPTLKNIEIISIKSIGYGILDLSKAEGVKQIGFDGSPGSGEVRYVGDAALFVANQTGNASAMFRGDTAETLSLSLTNVGAQHAPLDVYFFEQNDVGPQATAHNIIANNAFAQFYRSNSGAAVLDVTVKATGTNAITLSELDATTVKTVTVTGSGSVDFSGRAFSSQLITFTGSTGNDSIAFDGAPAVGAVINGGGGRDTFGITADGYATVAGRSSQDRALISGFEVLEITSTLGDTTIDLSKLTGVTSFVAGGGLDSKLGDVFVTHLGANATVELQGQLAEDTGTLHLVLDNATASNDVLNLILNTRFDQTGDAAIWRSSTTFGIAQIETLNVVSTATANYAWVPDDNADIVENTISLLDSASLTTLNVTGDQAFTFHLTSRQDNLKAIDASALTASARIDASGFDEPVVLSIKGSLTAANTLIGRDTGDTIIGGANADFITGGFGADILTGGGGNDTFVYQRASDSSEARLDIITDFVANKQANGINGGAAEVELRDGDVLRFNSSATTIVVTVLDDIDAIESYFDDLSTNGVTREFGAALDSKTGLLYIGANDNGVITSVIQLTGVSTITAAAFELFDNT